MGFVMVLPILVAEFELGTSFLLQSPFIRIELRKRLNAMLAVISTAFIDRNLFPHFPAKECKIAVGAEVL